LARFQEAPRFREHISGGKKAGVRTLMAFGFGFNKQKVLSAAEKYVQQGKLQNAIAEYEKILKADPKDLTVLNTVGDLYSRNGEVDKATECFKNVGDAYAAQGFTVKGIAMYKKIGKLKPSLESVLKLAELYTQQGLFNDARAQYLQVAEEFLRAGELEQSVRIFQKILEMDPENVAMRVRLAEVYIRLGKKTDAWQIFSAAAETLRNRGSRSGAEEILKRMLTLDPGNSYALLLRARNALESGDAASAIPLFQKVSDLDSHPDGQRDLLKAYLQTGRVSEAGGIAVKLLEAHNDSASMFSYLDAMLQNGAQEDAIMVIDGYADRLLADNSGKILEILRSSISPLSNNPAALEKVLELFQKAGDQSHTAEVYELLAHAYVQAGELSRARDLYQSLAEQEPQNPMHMQNYQQVVGMMAGGSGSRLITVEEGATNRRCDLNVRQVIGCVEDVEGAVAKFVVRKLRLLERRIFINDHEGTRIRRSAERIVYQPCGQHLIGGQQLRHLLDVLTCRPVHAPTTNLEPGGICENCCFHREFCGIRKGGSLLRVQSVFLGERLLRFWCAVVVDHTLKVPSCDRSKSS